MTCDGGVFWVLLKSGIRERKVEIGEMTRSASRVTPIQTPRLDQRPVRDSEGDRSYGRLPGAAVAAFFSVAISLVAASTANWRTKLDAFPDPAARWIKSRSALVSRKAKTTWSSFLNPGGFGAAGFLGLDFLAVLFFVATIESSSLVPNPMSGAGQ